MNVTQANSSYTELKLKELYNETKLKEMIQLAAEAKQEADELAGCNTGTLVKDYEYYRRQIMAGNTGVILATSAAAPKTVCRQRVPSGAGVSRILADRVNGIS